MTEEEALKRYDELNIAMKQIIDGRYDINLDKTNPDIIDFNNPKRNRKVITARSEDYEVEKDIYNSITYKLKTNTFFPKEGRLLFLAVGEDVDNIASKTYRICVSKDKKVLNVDVICSYKPDGESSRTDITVVTDELSYEKYYELVNMPLNFHTSKIRYGSNATFFKPNILLLLKFSFYSVNALMEIYSRPGANKYNIDILNTYYRCPMEYTKNDIMLITYLQELSKNLYYERKNIDDFKLKRNL